MRLFLYLFCPAIVICCEDSWLEFNGYCYRRFSFEHLMEDRLDYFCKGYGARIASISSDAELQLILNMTQTGRDKHPSWQTIVGAYRNVPGGAWKWYDGTPFNQNHRVIERYQDRDHPCLVLMSDKRDDSGGATHISGRIGIFAPFDCITKAHQFVCKKQDTTNRRTERMCGSTWTTLRSNCYKRFSVPSINVRESENYCRSHGGHLVSVTTEEEKNLVIEMTRTNHQKWWSEQTVVGLYRESYMHPWKWYDGTPFNQSDWFYLDLLNNENCGQLFPDPCANPATGSPIGVAPVYYYGVTGRFCPTKCSFPAHEFVCEKKSCDLSVSSYSGGVCVCNDGLIDITDTSLLEAKKYSKGEKCIPNHCHIKKDTSVLFIIDSSESVTKAHWTKMLKFVQSAANMLPTKFRIGFLKFSTKVSKGKWLKRGWTENEFKKTVSSKYAGGARNTPAALKQAKQMFSKDDSDEKIAVLITDGLPVSDEYNSTEKILKATLKAAKNLRKDGVRLIVMGAGPEIFAAEKKVKTWVQNPDHDFHLNPAHVGLLNGKDMDNIMRSICN